MDSSGFPILLSLVARRANQKKLFAKKAERVGAPLAKDHSWNLPDQRGSNSMAVGVHQVDRVIGHVLHARLQGDRAGPVVE